MVRRVRTFGRRAKPRGALAAPLSKEAREWLKVLEEGQREKRGPIPKVTAKDIRPSPDPTPVPKGPAYDWDLMFEEFTSDVPAKPPRAPAPTSARSAPAPTRRPARSRTVVEEVEVLEEAPAPRRREPALPAPSAPPRTAVAASCRFVVLLSESARDAAMFAPEDDDEDEDREDVEEGDDGMPDFDVMDDIEGLRGLGAGRKVPHWVRKKTASESKTKKTKAAEPAHRAGTGPRARAGQEARRGTQPTGSFMWDDEAHPTFELSTKGYNGALTLSSRLNAQIALVCGDSSPFGLVDCGSGDCFPAGFALKSRREIPKGDFVPGVRGLKGARRAKRRKAPTQRKRR